MANPKKKLVKIDVDELFSSSVNRGMLSFLERPPEEARERLLEKEKVDRLDSNRLDHPEGKLPTWPISGRAPLEINDGAIQPVGDTPGGVNYSLGISSNISPRPPERVTTVNERARSSIATDKAIHPVGNSPIIVVHPVGILQIIDVAANNPPESGAATYPLGISPIVDADTSNPRDDSDLTKNITPIYSLGESLSGYPASVAGSQATPRRAGQRTTLSADPQTRTSEVLDGKMVGRRQKIRRAVVAQDGHSSGEQLLYQSLWNAAKLETQETRVLSVGYKGMSMLCKLDHSNCKKNVQNLIEKLAVEVIDSYDRATSTGTTYRLFSYKEILRRREDAGLVWVIRANGVKFVNMANPPGNPPTASIGVSPSGAAGNLPSGARHKSPTGPTGKSPSPPLGEAPIQLGKEETFSKNSTSTILLNLLQAQLPSFDDSAVEQLWKKCFAMVSDVTEEEVSALFSSKLPTAYARGITNPNGFLLKAVSTSCTRAAIDAMRRERELAEPQEEPDVIPTRQEQIANYESYLKALPNHPAAKLWRSKLDELREGN